MDGPSAGAGRGGQRDPMKKRISYFDVYWNRQQQIGVVRLAFDDRSFEEIRDLPLEEMCLVCNMLRADKPVYYDPPTQSLATLPELMNE
jgi:hypothetical protein